MKAAKQINFFKFCTREQSARHHLPHQNNAALYEFTYPEPEQGHKKSTPAKSCRSTGSGTLVNGHKFNKILKNELHIKKQYKLQKLNKTKNKLDCLSMNLSEHV
jgi:hypothetical protein